MATALMAFVGLGLAGCSSGPPMSAGSARTGPTARLGASPAAWQATRVGNGYGSAIVVNGQSTAQFSAVTTADGQVSSGREYKHAVAISTGR